MNVDMPTFDYSPLFGVLYLAICSFSLYLIVRLFSYVDSHNYGVILPVMIVVFSTFYIILFICKFDPKTETYFEKMDQFNNYMNLRNIAKAKLLQETEQKIEEIIKTL